MPELAASYVVGVLISFLVTALNIGLRNRHRKSTAYRRLEQNLRRADFFWSDNEDRIVDWSETRAKEDASRGNTSFIIAGALIAALSWAGALFLVILVLSEHVIARSRREKAVFASALAQRDELSRHEVETLVKELNSVI